MERSILEYLANSIWQVPLLAGGAWLVLRVVKPGPRVQHGVWLAALVLGAVLPVLPARGVVAGEGAEKSGPQGLKLDCNCGVYGTRSASLRAGSKSVPLSKTGVSHAGVSMTALSPTGASLSGDAAAPAGGMTAGLTDATKASSSAFQDVSSGLTQTYPKAFEGLWRWARWLRVRELRLNAKATLALVGLYLGVIALMLMRLLWSWRVARRMVAEASPSLLTMEEFALLEQSCERFGVRRPAVRISAATTSPLVVGAVEPVLLLPERFADRAGRELEAVWLHELAHIRRRDYLANLVCRIVALPVAYHPATYAIERRVRQTREMVCDRMAAEAMQSPVGYARCLVGLAQRMSAGHGMAVGMFDGGVLEERVMELIEKKAGMSVRAKAIRLAGGVVVLLAVLVAGATFHVTPTLAKAVIREAPATSAGAVAAGPVASAGPIDSAIAAEPILLSAELQDESSLAERQGPLENDPGFQSLPAETQQSIRDSFAQLRAIRPQVWKQIEDAERQAKRLGLNSLEYRKALADATAAGVNTPEFRMKLDEASRAAAQAGQAEARERLAAKLNDPQFRKELAEAAARLNTPEFREGLDGARIADEQARIADAQAKKADAEAIRAEAQAKIAEKLNSPEYRKQLVEAVSALSGPTVLLAGLAKVNIAYPTIEVHRMLKSMAVAVQDRGDSFEKTLTVSGAPTVSISSGSGYIHVLAGSDSQVHVIGHVRAYPKAGSDAPERVKQIVAAPPIAQTGNLVSIGAGHENAELYKDIAIDYDVTLPHATTLTADTGSGSIQIGGITGTVNANSGSGEVKAENIGANSHLQTGSGSIRASDVHGAAVVQTGSGSLQLELTGAGDVKAQTGSGTIHIGGLVGGLRAETGSGSIEIAGSPTADWHLETGSGSVQVKVPTGAHYTVDLGTGSGTIHTEQQITMQGTLNKHHVTGTVNGGGPTIKATSGSGGIDIQ